MKKTKDNKKTKYFKWYIIICLLIGISMGFIGATYPNLSIISKLGDNLFDISLFLIIFVLAFIVHIILHELGHLIFGFLTGYKFVSFRIGSLTLVIEDKKFKIKKYNIPGTAGQCLMMPPEIKDEKFPFVIYNLGGVLINLIISIISFTLLNKLNSPYDLIALAFLISGIFVVITNGIPFKIGGVPNDAHNILTMIKDKESRMSFYMQLKVNALLTFGKRLKDIDLQDLELDKIQDLSNPLNTSAKLIEYSWYLDKLDIKKAHETLNSLIPCLSKIVPIYRNEINLERIFLELIQNNDKKYIDSLYSKSLKKYIKAAKFMINKKRFLVAYELYYNENEKRALEYFQELKDLAKDYPVRGEAEMEISICEWMFKEN